MNHQMNDQKTGRCSVDRRTLRTRARLHDALKSLIAEESYEAIAVKHICERARVSRSAFYAHYATKDDLMRSGFDRLRTLAVTSRRCQSGQQESSEQRFAFSPNLLHHARDHFRLHARLGDRGVAIAREAVQDVLSDLVRCGLSAAARRDRCPGMPREFVVQYLVGATMAVITWWLEGGAKVPALELDTMLRNLAVNGIDGLNRP